MHSCKVKIPEKRLSNLCHRMHWPAFLQWLMEKKEQIISLSRYGRFDKKSCGETFLRAWHEFERQPCMCTKCIRISFCDRESFAFHPERYRNIRACRTKKTSYYQLTWGIKFIVIIIKQSKFLTSFFFVISYRRALVFIREPLSWLNRYLGYTSFNLII